MVFKFVEVETDSQLLGCLLMYLLSSLSIQAIRSTRTLSTLGLALVLSGCARNIGDDSDSDTDTAPPPPKVIVEDGFVIVDASDKEEAVYVNMATQSEVIPTSPEDSTEWDLSMKRYVIHLNGGINGTGGMEALELSGESWDDTSAAPDGEYVTDQEDVDEDGVPDWALSDWYEYDPSSHNLSPYDVFYAIRATNGTYYKFRVHDYYDSAGSPAILKLEWEEISPPAAE